MVLSKTPGVPHKGWNLHDVVDARDELGLKYGNYEDCQFCGQDQIRWIHILQHPDYPDMIEVGCDCAEKLTEDYVNPKRRENELRNRSSRRSRFPSKQWKISANGNHHMKHEGRHLLAYKASNGKFKIKVGEKFYPKFYNSFDEAKMGIFDIIEPKQIK